MLVGNFYLGVWHSRTAVSDEEAARQYSLLGDKRSAFRTFDSQVYAFYYRLVELYPDIDMVAEDDLDGSPWASSIELSDGHVILSIRTERAAQVVPRLLALAEQHDLLCFDPQSGKVHLPPHLRARGAGTA